jgi:hypothetical protein
LNLVLNTRSILTECSKKVQVSLPMSIEIGIKTVKPLKIIQF